MTGIDLIYFIMNSFARVAILYFDVAIEVHLFFMCFRIHRFSRVTILIFQRNRWVMAASLYAGKHNFYSHCF